MKRFCLSLLISLVSMATANGQSLNGHFVEDGIRHNDGKANEYHEVTKMDVKIKDTKPPFTILGEHLRYRYEIDVRFAVLFLEDGDDITPDEPIGYSDWIPHSKSIGTGGDIDAKLESSFLLHNNINLMQTIFPHVFFMDKSGVYKVQVRLRETREWGGPWGERWITDPSDDNKIITLDTFDDTLFIPLR